MEWLIQTAFSALLFALIYWGYNALAPAVGWSRLPLDAAVVMWLLSPLLSLGPWSPRGRKRNCARSTPPTLGR